MNQIVSCVTEAQLMQPRFVADFDQLYVLSFNPAVSPVILRSNAGNTSGLGFSLRHQFQLVEYMSARGSRQSRISTVSYEYVLSDSRNRELLVYHWNPVGGKSGPDYPHLHVSASVVGQMNARETHSFDLDKLHLPTSRISLESFVRMLITEWNVKARIGNWSERLDQSERLFRERQTRRR